MKAVGIFAIDSYHLTGGHFPSVAVSCIRDDINDVFDWLMHYVEVYPLKLENHKPITREMLEEEFNNAKYSNVRIHFYYPREGDLQIEFER